MFKSLRIVQFAALGLVAGLLSTACTTAQSDANLVVYSGRTENLIGPLLQEFTKETGIQVSVRYGQSADLALQIETEGERTPADVFISQSPGAAGFLAEKGHFSVLPDSVADKVEKRFRGSDNTWVGMSGRVRVLAYNNDQVKAADLPKSVFDLTDKKYAEKVGLAPNNGSFQDFVTAMRAQFGDDKTQAWLTGMAQNGAVTYANNTSIVQAVGRDEVPMGLVNHYYNERALAENPDLPSRNYFFPDGDIGSVLIATAVGILNSTTESADAQQLVSFLLDKFAQEFFATETFEYPLAKGIEHPAGLPPLNSLDYATVDLDQLGGGLAKTLQMIEASGLASS